MFTTDPELTVRAVATREPRGPGAVTFSMATPTPARASLAPGPFARISGAFERRVTNPLLELAAAGSVRLIKEPKTGTTFPEEYCTRDRVADCAQLTGVGVRSKRLLGLKNLNIYSIGLYVDPNHTIEKFQKYGYLSQAALKQTSGMYQDVCRSPTLEKTIRLVVVYGGLKPEQTRKAFEERLVPVTKQLGFWGVGFLNPKVGVQPEQIRKAFEERLVPVTKQLGFWGVGFLNPKVGVQPEQIRKAFEERLVPVMKQDKRSLQRFMGHFNGLKLHKGSTLVFTAHGGNLTTTVDSKELGTIASHELCNSLFSIYLGPDPVSKECKDDFAVGMYSLLQEAKRAGKFRD